MSFIYARYKRNLRLSNVPSLVEVSIFKLPVYSKSIADFMSHAFTQLPCCLSQLETLMLNIGIKVSVYFVIIMCWFIYVFVGLIYGVSLLCVWLSFSIDMHYLFLHYQNLKHLELLEGISFLAKTWYLRYVDIYSYLIN